MIGNAAVGFAGGGIGALFGVALAVGTYFIPTIIAYVRKVTNVGSVFVINLFLGWTFIGWIVALAMSVKTKLPNGLSSQVTVVTGSNVHLKGQEAAKDPGVLYFENVKSPHISASEQCNRCSEELTDGAKFCIKCGEPVQSLDPTLSTFDSKRGISVKWCSSCKKELDSDVRFCSQCGADASEVNSYQCSGCNGPITLEDKFCPMCGINLH